MPTDVMVKLNCTIISCIPICLMFYWHGKDRDVLMLLRINVLTGEQENGSHDYKKKILTCHSIYDYLTVGSR